MFRHCFELWFCHVFWHLFWHIYFIHIYIYISSGICSDMCALRPSEPEKPGPPHSAVQTHKWKLVGGKHWHVLTKNLETSRDPHLTGGTCRIMNYFTSSWPHPTRYTRRITGSEWLASHLVIMSVVACGLLSCWSWIVVKYVLLFLVLPLRVWVCLCYCLLPVVVFVLEHSGVVCCGYVLCVVDDLWLSCRATGGIPDGLVAGRTCCAYVWLCGCARACARACALCS